MVLGRAYPFAQDFRISVYFRQHFSFCNSRGSIPQRALAIQCFPDHCSWLGSRASMISRQDQHISCCDTQYIFIFAGCDF